ncbi:MAG: DUF4893 domain-containing protein [Sphingomonas sp.]|uniref:DUF4893 domain-containing protein n=1 Tax=Sphingomonas sp. TaxID=28214 RepID=UPI0025D91FF7|nr:DUF4893 domain-containing protein [Sphingomonas sp.]MBX9880753.1 DUF4893 domain-containing protein [Sphingomonas sp.]
MAAGPRNRRRAALGLALVGGLLLAASVPRWDQLITDADRDRLRSAHNAWVEALARVRPANAATLDAEGALFDADRAFEDGALPPAGAYRCRVFKLGANGTAMAEFTTYPAARCAVTGQGDARGFAKLDGEQRPAGTLYAREPARGVFLGALELGMEQRPMDYGTDAKRDLAGFVERVGERRWRVVLPYPRFESILDVIELVPEG